MVLTNEDKLMQLCARVTMDEARQVETKGILKKVLDWDYIIQEASKEGIASLLFYNLRRFPEGGFVPSKINQGLEQEYTKTAFRNVIFLQELGEILKVFKEANISAIVLKGGFLIENVYKDLGLRPMSDLDLLVKKEDLINIYHNLNRLGYDSSFSLKSMEDFQNSPFSSYLNSIVYTKKENIRLCLNLHWHLANSIFPLYLGTKINIDKIWQEARPCKGVSSNEWLNHHMLTMAPHHLLIHLSEHAFRHCFEWHIWLVDIAEVIRVYQDELDWDKFVSDTLRFKLNVPVFYSLYLASHKLGADIPEDILAALKPKRKGYGESIFLRYVLKDKRFEASLSICKSPGQRMVFLWRLLFPPRQVLAQLYLKEIHKINLFHYLFRIFRGFGYIVRGCLT